jgi:hypothetical protein
MEFRSCCPCVSVAPDALGRNILFVGYSTSEPNIPFHRIWQTWERSGHKDDRPRSFVFMASPNPIQEAVLARSELLS